MSEALLIGLVGYLTASGAVVLVSALACVFCLLYGFSYVFKPETVCGRHFGLMVIAIGLTAGLPLFAFLFLMAGFFSAR